MKTVSRMIFAAAGIILELVAGTGIGFAVGWVMIYTGAGGTGLDNAALVVALSLCGAVVGLAAGLILSRRMETKTRNEQVVTSAPASSKDVWPPPPNV